MYSLFSSNGPLRSFNSPQFRLLWVASLASITSFFMVIIARGWLILEITDSVFLVTAVNAIGLLPTLFFSLHGGVMADRMDRKLILIYSDTLSVITIFIFTALMVFDVMQVWHIFFLTLIHGASHAIGMPSRAALVPNLVRNIDIPNAVALYTAIFSAGLTVGPGMAGFLINSFGMSSPFVISIIVLVFALFFLVKLNSPLSDNLPEDPLKVSMWKNIIEGLNYVRHQGILFGLIVMGIAVTVFAMPYQTLLPVFARDILNVGASGLGWLGAVSGAGSIAGSLAVVAISSPKKMKFFMLGGSIGLGSFIFLFAISTNYLISTFVLFCVGFFFQVFMTGNFIFVQLITPDYIRGRVVSIRMVSFGLSPAGMLLLGISAELLGPVIATALTGMITVILVAIIIIFISELRHIEKMPEKQSS